MYLDFLTQIRHVTVGFLLCSAAAVATAQTTPGEVQLSPAIAPPPSASTDVDLSTTLTPAQKAPARFIARKEPVEQLFKAIGSEIRKASRFSNKARQYRISGEFDLSRPFEVIERVTSSLGLIWYFDGQVIYVYDNSEVASAMITVSPDAVDNLIASLKNSALYDKRFPIKHAVGSNLIYVSGPPKYVEIVQNTASLLHSEVQIKQRGERHVEIVKVRHALVADRNYTQRGVQESVAGLAQVLAAALGSGAAVSVAPTQAQTDAATLPRTSASALPPGIGQMPAMDAQLPLATALPAMMPTGLAAAASPAGPSAASSLPRSDDAAAPMTIVAHTSSNSLLLEGTAHQLATARRLIEQLDVPKAQVELSLWVIDVQKANLDNLGAKWSASGKAGPVEIGFNLASLSQGATLSRQQTMQFMASVAALSQQNKARIVSRPILLAQDNSPAVFDNSKTFLVSVKGERVAQLERITYGTMISVTPHVVSPNGRIEMELDIEDGHSSDPTKGSGLELPVVSNTKISTVARVLHEQSLLVGGYTQSHNSEGVEKIPLLGDIPWVGHLFKFKNTNDQQSVRLFLIQPRMLAEDSVFERERLNTPPEINDATEALRRQVEFARG